MWCERDWFSTVPAGRAQVRGELSRLVRISAWMGWLTVLVSSSGVNSCCWAGLHSVLGDLPPPSLGLTKEVWLSYTVSHVQSCPITLCSPLWWHPWSSLLLLSDLRNVSASVIEKLYKENSLYLSNAEESESVCYHQGWLWERDHLLSRCPGTAPLLEGCSLPRQLSPPSGEQRRTQAPALCIFSTITKIKKEIIRQTRLSTPIIFNRRCISNLKCTMQIFTFKCQRRL